MNFQYPDPALPPLVIVDDSEDDRFLVRHRLREGGICNPIVAFESSAEALDYLRCIGGRDPLPAMIFTDIRMPVDSGFALIAAVRENSAWEQMRVVVMTSSNDSSDLVRALELGASGYLIKFPPADILADFVHRGPWFAIQRSAPAVTSTALVAAGAGSD
jgi:CheY-like chemotaxis protein